MSRLEERFWRFHVENPDVFETLVKLARQAKAAGQTKYGVAALFEVMRWQHAMEKRPGEPFKLCNGYRAFYARLVMSSCADLAGFFDIREQRAV